MRKKLFAVIMSIMMMVTFMPTMAFAAGCAHNEARVKFAGWSKDYKEANFQIVCANPDCTIAGGKVFKSFSVETERYFDGTDHCLPIIKKGSETTPYYETGAIYTLVYLEDVIDKAEAIDDDYTEWELPNRYGTKANDYPTTDYTVTFGLEYPVYLTSYYDFKGAALADEDGKVLSKFNAEDYLDLLTSNNSYAEVVLTEPDDIESYGTVKNRSQSGYVSFEKYRNDKKPYYAAQLFNTEELFMAYPDASNTDHMKNPANRDVRMDLTMPLYAPYEDNVTVDFGFKLTAYADIEEDFDVRVVNLPIDTTQKVAITTNVDDLDLDYYISKVKGEALPEGTGDATKLNIKKFEKVFDTESAAKRAIGSQRTDEGSVYIGEDVCYEIATKGVTVQYGAIDQVGNVTWSNEAPEIVDVKYQPEGFYADEYYHFLVKVTKGSKTVYAHIQYEVEPATLDIGFNQSAFVCGKGETLEKKDILSYGVIEGLYFGMSSASDVINTAIMTNKADVYEKDKAVADLLMDKFIKVNNASTDKLGEKTMTFSFDMDALEKEAAETEDETATQFMENYNFYYTLNDYATFLKNSKKDSLLEAVKGVIYPKTAKLTVGDVYNQIKFSNRIKTYHIKKAAKLKKTKTFQLKAKANYGKVTFKKVTAKYSKIKVSSTGKVTVKKGLKKGTYKIKVNAYAPNKVVKRTILIKIKK